MPIPQVQRTVNVIQAWRESLGSDIVVAGHLQAFLIIGQREYITMTEIAGQMKVRISHVSKIVQVLGQHRGSGLGLIEWQIDDYDIRKKLLTLTTEGKAIYGKLKRLMEG